MKALSLWQPHALAIQAGLKTWETRDWATSYRGPLAIQAAKRVWSDSGAWHEEAARGLVRKLFPSVTATELGACRGVLNGWLVYGAVVCVVDVLDCIPTERLAAPGFWGDFGPGRYAWKLGNVRQLERPLPVRGQQGFFEVDLSGFVPARREHSMPLFGE